MQRVKILYNKKDSALIQMAEPQQAYLGKSNTSKQQRNKPRPAIRPKSNEKSALVAPAKGASATKEQNKTMTEL